MELRSSDIYSAIDLQEYLHERTSKARRLYHYTTFESLVCIIKNKSFRLSRMDLMNDKAEQKLGRKSDQLESYLMSFTRKKEYVSMWAMYGKASGIKLRVDFSFSKFAEAINNNFYFDPLKEQKIKLYSNDFVSGPFEKLDYLISDIVYMDKEALKIRHDSKTIPSIIATEDVIHEMAGFIKYDAWEFERETRLRVLLRHTSKYNNQKHEIPRYIYAGIDDNLIHDFHITFNPWMSNDMKEEIKLSLNRLSGCELQYKDSQNDGEITEL